MNLLKRKTLIKVLLTNIVIVLLFIIIFVVVIKMQNKVYSKIVNEKINDIINNVMEKYPEVKEEDILKIINNRDDSSENILEKYGYDDELSYIKELRENINKNLKLIGKNYDWLKKQTNKFQIMPEEALIVTINEKGDFFCQKKENKQKSKKKVITI